MVLLDSGDNDFVAAPITSHARLSEFDMPVREWRAAGLNVASTIRVHKLTVLAMGETARRVGELSGPDRAALAVILRRAFSLD